MRSSSLLLLFLASCHATGPSGVVPESNRYSLAAPDAGPVDLPAFRPTRRMARHGPPKHVETVQFTPRPETPLPGHAADYRWLRGRLRFDPVPAQWSLQYGEAEADDFGGVLELVAPGPMEGFRPGQLVRVEGALIDPAPLQTKPGYRPTCVLAQER